MQTFARIIRAGGLIVTLIMTLALLPTPFATGQDNPKTVEWVVIVHPDNKDSIDKAAIRDIFLRRKTKWSDNEAITPYQYKEDSSERAAFARELLEMSAAEEEQYWVDARVRFGTLPPRVKTSTRIVRIFVARQKGAIGFIPASEVEEGKVRVIHRFNVKSS